MAATKKTPRKKRARRSQAVERTYRSEARTRPEVPRALARLGRTIRVLREEAGLTQEAAAGEAHLDAKHWQELEAGRVNPTVATLVGVARALRVTLAEVFEGV